MNRDNLKEECAEIVMEQLTLQTDGTFETYETLIKHGYTPERAVQKLAFYIEKYMFDIVECNKEFDDEEWNIRLRSLKEDSIENAQTISSYQLKKSHQNYVKSMVLLKKEMKNHLLKV